MSKSAIRLVIGGTAISAAATAHALPTPIAASAGCTPGNPSVLIHVAGFKQLQGRVKVSLYGPDADRWLARGGRIGKVKVPVTGRSMDICMPVPGPGRYAVAVHHDLNRNGERDLRDGGGYSRDPKVTLVNPKPPYAKAAFTVGNGPARVGVTLIYMRGLTVEPVGS